MIRCFFADVEFSRKSYSQFGEDLVLSSFIKTKEKGFYVDVGAYHPKKFSNTYFYYTKGWCGINIDAKPGSMELFKDKRKRDINLEIGVSKKERETNFYIFKESAYNTFSKNLADRYINQGILLHKKISVETMRLENILDKYLPAYQEISFMSVDAEGLDLEVLESNNWTKYKPKYILCESHDVNITNVQETDIYKFLVSKEYKLISIVYLSLIFEYEPKS